MDVDAIQEKYGIAPKQLIEVKSLMGDASDNIPGVKGIGEKTALSLVQNFGSLEGVYENIDDKRIKPKQREHLLEDKSMAELSHTLGTIRADAPIDTAEGAYTVGEGNKAEAVRLLQELEIHSLIPRFGLDGVAPSAPEEEAADLLEAEIAALPLTPAGHYLVASRPAVMGKQGTRNVMLQTLSACWTTPTSHWTCSTLRPCTQKPWLPAAGAAASYGTASLPPTCWTPPPPNTRSASWCLPTRRLPPLPAPTTRTPGGWPTCLPK